MNITGIPPDCIPANPDVAGIGIRVAVYVQSFMGIAISLWAMRDNKLTKGEARVIWTHATGVLLTSCALFLSAIIQAKTYGMSTYHGLIILNLGWINNASDFLRHFVTVHRRVTGRKPEAMMFGLFKTNSPLLALWASSVHTILLAIFGLWFWATVDTFGNKGQCDPHLPIPLYILGHRVPITDPGTRIAFLVVYSILLSPARSLITIPFIATPAFIVLRIIRPFIKKKADESVDSKEFYSNALLMCMMIIIGAINVAIVVGTESMIRDVSSIVGEGESQWTFGQTIAMFLLVPPIIELLHVWKEKDGEVDSLVGSDSASV